MPLGDRLVALLSCDAGEDKHPLQVPGHGDEAPFAARALEAAQQELARAQHRFHDAEHRLGRVLAQRLELAAFGGLEPVGHGVEGRRILARRR